jgi:hypothetical protein
MGKQLAPALYRVIAKSQAPEFKQVGGKSLLTFTIVPDWVPDKEAKVFYKAQLWGKDADKWNGNLENADVIFAGGTEVITENVKSVLEGDEKVRYFPYIAINLDGYSMKKVQIQKLDSNATPTQATEDIIAAKIAASSEEEDQMPF